MGQVLLVQILDETLPHPKTAFAGDAGLDLYSASDATLPPGGGRGIMGTGVAVAIPPGYVGLVTPRSGLAAQHGVTVGNAPGVVDSGFRGELQVVLVNTDPSMAYSVRRGDRVAQLVVLPIAGLSIELTDALPISDRGERGLGSTGR